MTKVVYNKDYGGFGLSEAAMDRYWEIKGIVPVKKAHRLESLGDMYYIEGEYWYDGDLERTDPVLVQVVEELGEKSNGRCAELAIAEIPEGTKYRIDEYDGFESVMTIDDYKWSVA